MNNFSGCLDGHSWHRVSKAKAKKAYDAGEEVLLCAAKLNPFCMWRPGSIIHDANGYGLEFDEQVSWYCWYNANSYETGTYAAYYLKGKG